MSPARDRWRGCWEALGTAAPYYGVCNEPRYKAASLDDQLRGEFFASGESHVRELLGFVHTHLGLDRRPHRVLDFGCGVGRLTIPLARAADSVVGVDISAAMLDEARRNCARLGITNAEFTISDVGLTRVTGPFDLVHSFIVFQHIPPRRGYKLLDALLARLSVGGVGALHFTYARRSSRMRKVIHALRRSVPGVNGVVNLAQGRRFAEQMMPMHEYDMARVLGRLRDAGAADVHGWLTDHGGHLGVMLVFRRER